MKYLVILFISVASFSQEGLLKMGDYYLEDQLYIGATYNIFTNQPSTIDDSGFSVGFSMGYIRDVPFNKAARWAIGLGVGYNYDTFKHSLLTNGKTFFIDPKANSSAIRLHNIEFPLQLRWRNSDAKTYAFWRVYTGVRLSYNIANSFKYVINKQDYKFKNINPYTNFQTGIELSVGYSAINLFVYYGLTPIYQNSSINGENINTQITKIGLIFYLL